jgi:hypothetical protein
MATQKQPTGLQAKGKGFNINDLPSAARCVVFTNVLTHLIFDFRSAPLVACVLSQPSSPSNANRCVGGLFFALCLVLFDSSSETSVIPLAQVEQMFASFAAQMQEVTNDFDLLLVLMIAAADLV